MDRITERKDEEKYPNIQTRIASTRPTVGRIVVRTGIALGRGAPALAL